MSIDPTRTGLSTPAGLVPAGGLVEGGAEAVVESGGDREKVTAQALRVLGKGMTIWAPTAKRLLAACLGINPTREQQPTPETLKVHVEALGSRVVLMPCLDIELDAEETMYEIIRQALIKNGRLGPPHHCYFYQNEQKCNLDVKPADYHSEGEIKLLMLGMNDLPGKKEALDKVSKAGWVLRFEAEDLRADKDVVLAAVSQNGLTLGYAAKELRADKEVVLAAVSQDGRALEYAASALRGDRDVVLAAISKDGWAALKYAAKDLRADKEVVLAAVSQNGLALMYAAEDLKEDREVVFAAVRQDGLALCFASAALKADREVVLAAVRQNSGALGYAVDELQADPEVHLLLGL